MSTTTILPARTTSFSASRLSPCNSSVGGSARASRHGRHLLGRRTVFGVGLASSLLLASCGPSAKSASTSQDLSFAFWGPAFYQEFTAEMVEAFAATDPGFEVSVQPSEWSGYWDKMATQVAEARKVRFLTKEQVKELCGVCDATLWHWNRKGYLRAVKICNKIRYRTSDIQRILGERESK